MTKDAVSDWDTTAANNTDVGGIGINTGMDAGNVDNALREIMAQIADWHVGSEFIASADASDDATLDFTGFDAARYDGYEFHLANVVASDLAYSLLLRTSTNGGSSYAAGASDYAYSRLVFSTTGSTNHSTAAVATSISLGGAGAGISGRVTVFGPHLTSRTRFVAELAGRGSANEFYIESLAGERGEAADVDAVRFLMSTGNIVSGTITMYGLRNS